MFLWLLNLSMSLEVTAKARVIDHGVSMEYDHRKKLKVSQLLFVDNTTLI